MSKPAEQKAALRELVDAVIANKGFIRLARQHAEGDYAKAGWGRVVTAIEECERTGVIDSF